MRNITKADIFVAGITEILYNHSEYSGKLGMDVIVVDQNATHAIARKVTQYIMDEMRRDIVRNKVYQIINGEAGKILGKRIETLLDSLEDEL